MTSRFEIPEVAANARARAAHEQARVEYRRQRTAPAPVAATPVAVAPRSATIAAPPVALAAPARPAPRVPTKAERLVEARKIADYLDRQWSYAVAQYQRLYGQTEVEAMRSVVRSMPNLVTARDNAHAVLRRLGG